LRAGRLLIGEMMKTEFVQLDTGITIEFARSGAVAADSILFVHGLGTNLHQFEVQQRFFSQYFQVLLVSLRGHGGSTVPVHPRLAEFSIPQFAQDVKALLSRLDIHKVHFVGNSAGGLVGYQLLRTNVELLASVTTFGTTAELHSSATLLWFLTRLTRLLGPKTMGKLASVSTKDKAVAQKVAEMFATANKQAIWMTQANIADYDFTPLLKDHDLPMLLIKGEQDSEINAKLESTLQILKQKQRFKLAEIEGAGHFVNMEKPDRFNQILLDFLKDVQMLSQKELAVE
jgi:3-oxoadipate enol-lactonase